MLTEWVEWSNEEAATKWDAALLAFPNYNLYQSFGWGEYKRRHGWIVRRGTVLVDNSPAALAQCFVREFRTARVVVVWVPGGPVGNKTGCHTLGEALKRCYSGWCFFLRANILEEAYAVERAQMVLAGWAQAAAKVGHPLTFCLDLIPDEAASRQALTANWRHNLKRGECRNSSIQIWDSSQPLDPVFEVYQETCQLQGIPRTMTLADFYAMRDALGQAFKLMVAVRECDRLCAFRGFGYMGIRAYDLVAGVSESGRRHYANYPLMWRLLAFARDCGAQRYDLSGADSEKAAGVYNFKKGLGGRLVPLMGEWDWSAPAWLGRAMNLAIRYSRVGI